MVGRVPRLAWGHEASRRVDYDVAWPFASTHAQWKAERPVRHECRSLDRCCIRGASCDAWRRCGLAEPWLRTLAKVDLNDDVEVRVAIAGDWHSSGYWARRALGMLHDQAPDVRTVLHLGDFNLSSNTPWAAYRRSVMEAMAANSIERILVTPGNHDDWSQLGPRFDQHPGVPYWLPKAPGISFLPRGYRFEIGGRTFLSFGGAASPDQGRRIEGKDWWGNEEPTEADVARALAGGTVDVLLTHEAVDGGTRLVEDVIARPNRRLFDERGLSASRRSRAHVTEVWTRLAPRRLFHGHMHVRAEAHLPDSRSVYSLAANNSPGNLGILDLTDLSWSWLD